MSYLEPLFPLLLLAGFGGLVGLWRSSKRQPMLWLITISLAGILLLSINAIAVLFVSPLQMPYSENPIPPEPAEAIVILAGTSHRPSPNRPYTFPNQDTYERLQHGAWLFKHWKALPMLVCGGSLRGDEANATTMRTALESEGIPSDLIWVEGRSRNTHENAVFGSKILLEHGISRVVLVVEASSMPRAAAAFRKEGVSVVPAAMRFIKLDRSLMDFFPSWQAIAVNGETLHEVVGLAWYRIRGWI